MINFSRLRYIIRKYGTNEVLCGNARNFKFKDIDKLGDAPIKTYRSPTQAKTAFKCQMWHFDMEVVPVMETFEEIPSNLQGGN